MSHIDLKTQLNNLIQVQTLDTEIYSLEREKQAKPEEIRALEIVFESKKQQLAALEKTVLDLQKQKKEEELHLAAKDESAKKLQGQLFALKTNKDYQAMLRQINDARADCSVIEDKILQIMVQMDQVKGDVDKEKQVLQEQEKILNADKSKVQTRIKEIDDRLNQLNAQRKQAVLNIDPKVFAQYERVLLNRDGLAIVTVKNNSCQGCNMFVPPQVINLVKMYEHIVVCEMCNRILYIDDASYGE